MYGSPKYNGIEYDFEVPTNLTVSSPGGVSSIHHHWTKGFDGRGNSSSDIYAGQGPQYISGEYGSLYQQGQTSSQKYYPAPPDYKFWRNQEPNQVSTPIDQTYFDTNNIIEDSSYRLYPGAQDGKESVEQGLGPIKEGFVLLSDSNTSEEKPPIGSGIVNYGLILLVFLSLSFWTGTSFLYLKQAVNKGSEISWQLAGKGALFFTALLASGAWLKYS